MNSRAIAAAFSALLAAAVGAIINLFTTAWAWPIGIAVVVLVLAQAGFEMWRASAPEPPGSAGRVSVRQRMRNVIGSPITGVRHAGRLLGSQVKVKIRMRDVRNSSIVGVDGADGPDGPDGPDEQRPDEQRSDGRDSTSRP